MQLKPLFDNFEAEEHGGDQKLGAGAVSSGHFSGRGLGGSDAVPGEGMTASEWRRLMSRRVTSDISDLVRDPRNSEASNRPLLQHGSQAERSSLAGKGTAKNNPTSLSLSSSLLVSRVPPDSDHDEVLADKRLAAGDDVSSRLLSGGTLRHRVSSAGRVSSSGA